MWRTVADQRYPDRDISGHRIPARKKTRYPNKDIVSRRTPYPRTKYPGGHHIPGQGIPGTYYRMDIVSRGLKISIPEIYSDS
jgi:hypothetical protein